MTNTVLIYRYQTLDDFERGIYAASIIEPGVSRSFYDLAEYELPDGYYVGETMGGIRGIFDRRDMYSEPNATKHKMYIDGYELRKVRDIEPPIVPDKDETIVIPV